MDGLVFSLVVLFFIMFVIVIVGREIAYAVLRCVWMVVKR